jgi:putative oxidoreductase
MQNQILLASRVLMSFIFIMASYGAVLAPAGRAGYMASVGMPGFLAWPSAAFELGASLCLLVGFQTRYAALGLAAFCVAAAIIFHYRPGDQMQMMIMSKDLAMAGGLLALSVAGAGGLSLDAKLKK